MTKEILYNMVHSEKFLIDIDEDDSSEYVSESNDDHDIYTKVFGESNKNSTQVIHTMAAQELERDNILQQSQRFTPQI